VKTATAKQADRTLDNNSIVHLSEIDGKYVPVTCGGCNRRRQLDYRTTRSKSFTGLCYECSHPLRAGVDRHKSGSLIYRGKRDPDDPHHRLTILCYNCKKESYAWMVTVDAPEWSGLCSECFQNGTHPSQIYT
jgi:hypothetical protein